MLLKKDGCVVCTDAKKIKFGGGRKWDEIGAAGRSEGRDRDRLKGNGETESLKLAGRVWGWGRASEASEQMGGVRRRGEAGGGGAAAAAERSERRLGGRGDRDRSLKGNGERLGGWGRVSKGRKGRVGGWPPTAKKTKITTTTYFFPTFFPQEILLLILLL